MAAGRGWGLEFYDSIVNNDLQRLEKLVEMHRIDLDAKFTEVRRKNHLDLSPVHLVAYKGYSGMLQYLYDMKCDIHQITTTLRRTPFHCAILRHKSACFHKLLRFGADPDPRDTFGNSPCHYAAEDGAMELLDTLVQHNIDLNAQDITLKTALMKATRNGKVKAVKRLIEAGCSLNVRDKNRDTALHFAARKSKINLVSILIEAGSDVNIQNQWGNTPLMEAVSYNNKEATEVLLQANCDVNQRAYKGGGTALHISVQKNYHVITEQLLKTGNVNYVYNYQGELAIYHAILNQKLDTIKQFVKYNYDFDRSVKMDYDGTGGKNGIRISLEKGHFDTLTLLAQVGYVISYSNPEVLPPTGTVAALFVNIPPNINPTQPPTISESENFVNIEKFFTRVPIVRSLKQMCRKAIRKQVGFDVERKVEKLPIPTWLKDYLLLTDITL